MIVNTLSTEADPLLRNLNPEQLEAVTAKPGHSLVLAGAGTGKTKVLIHRIAWLIAEYNIPPGNILAVTFTNRAAREMRERIDALLGERSRSIWMGTFHSIAYRLLRRHAEDAGLKSDFVVIDAADQRTLVRRSLRALGHEKGDYTEAAVASVINTWKENGLLPEQAEAVAETSEERDWLAVYQHYQKQCERDGLVDFAELLLRAHLLFLNNSEVLHLYQGRFSQVLVDEFQDTNELQYAWLKVLAGDAACAMVVGDDDQSIYSWRGASAGNMQRFIKEYQQVNLVRLQQNYRSTQTILNAANALVNNNTQRIGKQLVSVGEEGEPIGYFSAFNEREEALFVADRATAWRDSGNRLDEMAVFYRTNALSRVVEQELARAGIPYRIYGGLRFFERSEVKDAMAYVRLANNQADNAAFERAVNRPLRGVGAGSLEKLTELAQVQGTSLWDVAAGSLEGFGRAREGIQQFVSFVEELVALRHKGDLPKLVGQVVSHSRLVEWYQKSEPHQAENRRENLAELVNATQAFSAEDFVAQTEDNDEGGDLDDIAAFISMATLDAGDRGDTDVDAVQLMTLHSSKGLEFPQVCIIGMEEELFPSQRSIAEGNLEEERRLCYVGITRAMRKLHLCRAESRQQYGDVRFNKVSRFIAELPPNSLVSLRPSSAVHADEADQEDVPSFKLGGQVKHRKFGVGMVTDYSGSGASAKVEVNFQTAGSKWLVVSLARLEALE